MCGHALSGTCAAQEGGACAPLDGAHARRLRSYMYDRNSTDQFASIAARARSADLRHTRRQRGLGLVGLVEALADRAIGRELLV